MIRKRKRSWQSHYLLQRVLIQIIGFSVAWTFLFVTVKYISNDIAYSPYGDLRNEMAQTVNAYAFEVMAAIWGTVIVILVGLHWKNLLHALKQREEEEIRRKNEMLAYLAHDLRTPLTSIVGYSKLMNQMEQIDGPAAKEYLQIIISKSEQLENMLDEFFEITKLETNNAVLELSNINLSEMLQQIVSEYQSILRDKCMKLQYGTIESAMVSCDTAKMERVFDNIIRNAMKYARDHSTIDVESRICKDQLHIVFSNESEEISQQQLKDMFQNFVRLQEGRTEVEGAGMGLCIVKEIIELHGGTVWAEYHNPNLEIHIKLNIIKSS